MQRLLTALGAFGLLLLFVSGVAHHTCSSKEMIEMKGSGFSVDEINNMCTSYKIQDQAPQAINQALQNEIEKNLQDGKRATPNAAQHSSQPSPYQVVQGEGTTCATQVGLCPLMQPGYRGAPCVCRSRYGQFPGVVR
ncbi:MAG: hypothetical protein AABZ34_04135 [Nitrospirota bacterium]